MPAAARRKSEGNGAEKLPAGQRAGRFGADGEILAKAQGGGIGTIKLQTFRVNCEPWQVPGVKEDIAMILERRGDVRLVEAREVKTAAPEQLRFGGT